MFGQHFSFSCRGPLVYATRGESLVGPAVLASLNELGSTGSIFGQRGGLGLGNPLRLFGVPLRFGLNSFSPELLELAFLPSLQTLQDILAK